MILWRKINRALTKLYKDVPNKHNNTDNNCRYDKATYSGRSGGNGQAPDGACTTHTRDGSNQAVEAIITLDMSVGAVISDYPL